MHGDDYPYCSITKAALYHPNSPEEAHKNIANQKHPTVKRPGVFYLKAVLNNGDVGDRITLILKPHHFHTLSRTPHDGNRGEFRTDNLTFG